MKNKLNKRQLIIEIVCLIIIICGVYFLGTINFLNINFNKSVLSYTENNNCSSDDLEISSNCLKNQLNTFYKYNLSQINKKEINLSTLKESGGTCLHYSNWFKDNLINLGFNSTTIRFYGEDTGHQITLSWTKNISNGQYCINDQLNIGCIKMGYINKSKIDEVFHEK